MYTDHQAAQARIDLWTGEIAAEPVGAPRQAMEDEDQDYVDLFVWERDREALRRWEESVYQG